MRHGRHGLRAKVVLGQRSDGGGNPYGRSRTYYLLFITMKDGFKVLAKSH